MVGGLRDGSREGCISPLMMISTFYRGEWESRQCAVFAVGKGTIKRDEYTSAEERWKKGPMFLLSKVYNTQKHH